MEGRGEVPQFEAREGGKDHVSKEWGGGGGGRGAQRNSTRAPLADGSQVCIFFLPLRVNSQDEKLLCMMCHISKTGHQ